MMPHAVRRTSPPSDGSTGKVNPTPHVVDSPVVLGSNSSPVLSNDDREWSTISDIVAGSSRASGSAGRVRTPSKQVTLPTVKRRDNSKQAWTDEANMSEPTASSINGQKPVVAMNGHHNNNNQENQTSDESSDEDSRRRAPDQLRMEFLECVMKKEYEDALKLCRMILIYEPSNPEAKSFLPLIQEKMELDAHPPNEDEDEEGSGAEDSDDDDDDSSDSDEDDSDDDETDDTDDDDNDTEEDEQETLVRAVLESRLDDTPT